MRELSEIASTAKREKPPLVAARNRPVFYRCAPALAARINVLIFARIDPVNPVSWSVADSEFGWGY